MKFKKLVLSVTFAVLVSSAYSQIVLDKKYESPIRVGSLRNGDVIYFDRVSQNGIVNIYKNNHTLLKSISLPFETLGKDYNNYDQSDVGKYEPVSVKFVSDKLFDLDNGLEILVNAPKIIRVTASGYIDETVEAVFIINDDGSVLFESQNTSFNEFEEEKEEDIFLDGTDYKMSLTKREDGTEKTVIYTLPGALYDITVLDDINNKSEKLNAYPNPAVEYTKIAYKLPAGFNQADLVIYNQLGQEIQRYKVGSAFSDILVNTTSFNEGTYIYHLITGDLNNLQGKFIVMK